MRVFLSDLTDYESHWKFSSRERNIDTNDTLDFSAGSRAQGRGEAIESDEMS